MSPRFKIREQKTTLLLFLAPVFITLISFIPCLNADFVNWDDNVYIYENEVVTEFNTQEIRKGLWKIGGQDHNGIYAPLTTLTFVLEKEIFGFENPFYWHLDNLILHLIVVIICFFVGLELGLSPLFASLLALLFGIHPMRVESVAWLTERKDVLYGLFYFLALFCYIRLCKKGYSHRLYVLIIFFFICSLLSKILAVTLPLAMFLVDYFIKGRFRLRDVLDKIPFLGLALFFGLLGIYFAQDSSISDGSIQFNLMNAVLWASNTLSAYFAKLIYPHPLLAIYSFPYNFGWHHYLAVLVPIGTIVLLGYTYFRKMNHLFFGLGFYLVNIIFTLQVIPFGQGYMADRFTYVAYFGLFFILCWSLEKAHFYFWKYRFLLAAPILFYLFTLGHQTFQQSKIWQNSETLWTHQLRYNDRIEEVYLNRSDYYRKNGRLLEADQDIDRAIAINEKNAITQNLKGQYLVNSPEMDRIKEALVFFSTAITLDSGYAAFYVNRAVALAKLSREDEALPDLDRAILMDPDNPVAYLNRAVILKKMGENDRCLRDLDRYLQFFPGNADIRVVKGQVLGELGLYREAITSIDEAIGIDGSRGLFYFERGLLHFRFGNYEQAKMDVDRSIQMNYRMRPKLADQILSFNPNPGSG